MATSTLLRSNCGLGYLDIVNISKEHFLLGKLTPEEVRHVSRNADSAYLFCIARDGKKSMLSQHFVTHAIPLLN